MEAHPAKVVLFGHFANHGKTGSPVMAGRDCRELLISRLQTERLWLPGAICRRTVQEQRARGNVLVRQLLEPILGPKDFELLLTGSLFGVREGRLAERLPMLLVFGYEIGRSIETVAGIQEGESGALALCALLNLGVSLFDMQCDAVPGGGEALDSVFDEKLLMQLIEAQMPRDDGLDEISGSDPNLRVLLKLIFDIFRRFQVGDTVENAASQRNLNRRLMSAYRAQRVATRKRADEAELFNAIEAKSRGPFLMMLDATLMRANSGADVGAAQKFAENIGTAFWLIDDFADLIKDARDGAANALLLKIDSCNGQKHDLADSMAFRACQSLKQACDLLGAKGSTSATRSRLVLLAHARSWLV
jgi:hypothetical protein